jgi:hypothetical protein
LYLFVLIWGMLYVFVFIDLVRDPQVNIQEMRNFRLYILTRVHYQLFSYCVSEVYFAMVTISESDYFHKTTMVKTCKIM